MLFTKELQNTKVKNWSPCRNMFGCRRDFAHFVLKYKFYMEVIYTALSL